MNDFMNIGFLIKQINDNFLRSFNCLMSNFDITFQQFQIIDFILSSDKQVSQKDIETYLQVAHPTVVGLLKRMEVKNFIVCSHSPNDKRVKVVTLTPKALELMEEIKKSKAEENDLLMKNIAPSQKENIIDALQILFENTKNN